MNTTQVRVEHFTNSQHQTKYRIVVDGKVVEDNNGIGFKSEGKAIRHWEYKNGIGPTKEERRAAHLAEQAKIAERRAAEEAEREETKNKILVLLEQRQIWNVEELKNAVGITGIPFNFALWSLGSDGELVHTSGSSTVHKKTKALMQLRQEARKAVGAYNNTPIDIIPDSNAAPVFTGEPASGWKLRKYGKYNPSTLLVTVGQHWLAPVAEAIVPEYAYDA